MISDLTPVNQIGLLLATFMLGLSFGAIIESYIARRNRNNDDCN